MDTLGELLARDRRSERTACRVGADTRQYDYDRFLTTAWQSGNYLRHLGVREGVVVGVPDDPIPEALLSALGAGLLGATTWVDPPLGADLRAIVAPAGEITAYGTRPGRTRVAYGGDVDDPSIERFEAGVWSENPTVPPERPGPDTDILTDGTRTYAQGDLLGAAGSVADDAGLDAGVDVVLRASLADPGTMVGVLAALFAGATLVFPDAGAVGTAATGQSGVTGDVAIGAGPESVSIDPGHVLP